MACLRLAHRDDLIPTAPTPTFHMTTPADGDDFTGFDYLRLQVITGFVRSLDYRYGGTTIANKRELDMCRCQTRII